MECYKIIYIERPNKRLDILQFLFFSTKLILRENTKRTLKEYRFEEANEPAVEAKFQHIMKTKRRIGYQITNEIHDPKYYNLYNKYCKSFKGILNGAGETFRPNAIEDQDGDYFLRYTTSRPQMEIKQFCANYQQLGDLAAELGEYTFYVKYEKFSFDLCTRFAFHPFTSAVRWTYDEPGNKMDCTLTRSVLKIIAEQERLSAEILPSRILFLSKGIVAYADIVTGKIYSVDGYEPSFHQPVRGGFLTIHPNLLSFMDHVWACLEEIVFDILYRNLHEDNEVGA